MRNVEMVTQMRSDGFGAHDMRFIRGYKTTATAPRDAVLKGDVESASSHPRAARRSVEEDRATGAQHTYAF